MMACSSTSDQKLEFMGCESFPSMDDFRAKLRQHQRDSGTAFVIFCSRSPCSYSRKSRKCLPPAVEYSWVQYVCIHSGRRGRKAKPNTRFADCNCPATINLAWDPVNQRMKLTKVDLRHSHETVEEFPEVYSKNRRLTQAEEDEVFRLTDSFHSPKEIRCHIKDRFGISLTGYDVRNLRRKRQLTMSEISELLSSINDAILLLDSERLQTEMDNLYKYLDKLKEALVTTELDSDIQTSEILGLPSKTVQTSIMSAGQPRIKAIPVRILPKAPLTSVSYRPFTVPKKTAGRRSTASLKRSSETSQSVSSIPSPVQLTSIPWSQLPSINFTSTTSQSVPASSNSVQLLTSSAMMPTPQTAVISSTVQPTSSQQTMAMPSNPTQSVNSLPITAQRSTTASPVTLKVVPFSSIQLKNSNLKRYVISSQLRRISNHPYACKPHCTSAIQSTP